MDQQQIKETVKQAYSEIATKTKEQNFSFGCCGVGSSCSTQTQQSQSCCPEQTQQSSSCCPDTQGSCNQVMYEPYSNIQGYEKEADLAQGCGLPTQFANIKEGQTVVDLGSGAGIDCFVAREIVGKEGKIIGIDFSEQMILKAQLISDKKGFKNVEFRKGDIEKMPLLNDFTDVVISNCVINLSTDKRKVFSEIFRVLKKGGHLCISDIVVDGKLPEKIRKASELYCACVGGALEIKDCQEIIQQIGFQNSEIKKQKVIDIPDEIFLKYLNQDELHEYKQSGTKIYSALIYAEKN